MAPPRFRRILVVVLDLAAILAVLMGMIRFIANHDGLQLLSTAVMVLLIQGVARNSSNKVHYEAYLVDLFLSDSRWEIRCREKHNGMIQPAPISFSVNELIKLEYSDRLQCYRLSFSRVVEGASNKTYHLLYVSSEEEETLTVELERFCGLQVVYMDRNAQEA